MERATGIGPVFPGWKPSVLPLDSEARVNAGGNFNDLCSYQWDGQARTSVLAGDTGFEPVLHGFGDRPIAVILIPYSTGQWGGFTTPTNPPFCAPLQAAPSSN